MANEGASVALVLSCLYFTRGSIQQTALLSQRFSIPYKFFDLCPYEYDMLVAAA